MTRVISGRARGRRLAVPPAGTRPTSDRAREALFNALATLLDFEGARVLDLYAGSGAVGLEALSRGAATAVLVESDRAAAAVAQANIEVVGLPGARVIARTVESYLASADESFDLVFADPPYAMPDDNLNATLRAVAAVTSADGIVVIERSARSPAPIWPDPLEMIKTKRYGEGALWYGRQR